MNRLAKLFALLVALPGCVAADQVQIPVQPMAGARVPAKPLSADILTPTGKPPFPAVIVLHGCGGPSSAAMRWATRLQEWGYAALVPDSFSARGVTTVCAPDQQRLVSVQDRAADVLSAALYLRTRPDIDGARIAVLGLSHGGRTAALATEQSYERLYPGLMKAAVNYYGPCGWPPEMHGTVPLLALAGEADDWGNPALSCRTYIAKFKATQPGEVYTYPGVGHAFDNPMQGYTNYLGHTFGYDERAANDSFLRVRAFLAKWLAHTPPG